MQNKIGSYLWRAFVLILFLVFSVLTLFFAYGYQFDFKKRDFNKTSIIDITAREKEVSVTVDGTQQTETMPFQVKGVLPGKHELSVDKNGFQPWIRVIDVEEDVVTIVNDVQLVPSEVEKSVKPLVDFTKTGEKSYFGNDYLVEIDAEGKILKLSTMYDDGSVKSEEIELFKAGIKDLQTLAGENFIIYFDDGGVSWVNFRDKKFISFNLPAGADAVKVGQERETVYFLLNGGLYGVPFRLLDDLPVDADKYLIIKRVEAYIPAFGGELYFISGGMLFKSDYQGRGKMLIDYAPGFYKNIDFLKGNEQGALVLRDMEEKRHLVLIGKSGRFTYLSGDLKGRPFFNGYDQMLYSLQSGEIFFYDLSLALNKLVEKKVDDFELLGWFSDRGHFLLKEGFAVKMSDVFNANNYVLLSDNKNISSFFTLKGSLFFIRERVLYVLNWNKKQ